MQKKTVLFGLAALVGLTAALILVVKRYEGWVIRLIQEDDEPDVKNPVDEEYFPHIVDLRVEQE